MGSEEITPTARCDRCKYPLSLNHQGPCPQCGTETAKEISVEARDSVPPTDNGFAARERDSRETKPRIKAVVIGITIGAPVLGLFVSGFTGFIVGLILGVIGYVISPLAEKAVKEILRVRFDRPR